MEAPDCLWKDEKKKAFFFFFFKLSGCWWSDLTEGGEEWFRKRQKMAVMFVLVGK